LFVIKKSRPDANVSRTIRFTEQLFEDLNKAAATHGVSLNSLVLQCCRYALDQAEAKPEVIEE